MRSTRLRKTLLPAALAVAILAGAVPAMAQRFGQNKVTYGKFEWDVYRSPHFDVHYYPSVEPFLPEIVSYAESAYLKISKELDHELKVRVPLIIYKTHGEFQQTNITLSELPEGVAAFAEPTQYRMVLPIDDPPDKLYKLIAHELTHIFEYSMFYNGSLGRAIRGRAPTWVMEGLASYMADDEDSLDRMAIRDAVVNNIIPPVQALNVVTFLTYRFGNAIFSYIEEEHGIEGLRTFLFEVRKVLLTGNISKAFKESFGYDINEFNRRFARFLRKEYFPILLEKKSPEDYATEIGVKQPGMFTFSPTVSPSGELVAAFSAPSRLEMDLLVLSAEDGRIVRNLTKGFTNDYRHLITEAYAGKRDVSWSPAGDRVAVFTRHENKWPLVIFNALNGKKVDQIKFPDIVQLASPSFSPDGMRIAFEGNRDGIVDIFEVDLETREVTNLTNDDFFDANPWYGPDGETLLYNRRIGEYWKVFSVELEDSTRKTQITFGQFHDIQPSYSLDGGSIFFSSDRGEYEVFNIYELDLSSGDLDQFTDVVGSCFTPSEMAERNEERNVVFQCFFEGTFRLYRMALNEPELEIGAEDRMALSFEDESEPFKPPLSLSIDEEEKRNYKVKFQLESPGLSVGVANDGTLLASGALTFTDLMGNHRIFIGASTVQDFASFAAQYINVKRRYTWGLNVYDQRDFFYVPGAGGSLDRQEEYKATGGDAYWQLPLSRHYRFQTSVGAVTTSRAVPDLVPGAFSRVSDTYGIVNVALVGDTTRFQSFGPFQGKRFNLGLLYMPQISGDSAGDVIEYSLEYRAYKKITRRSVLAWRFRGIYNNGDSEITYGFGGVNDLRGYDFREFIGSRILQSNLEYRFPLAEELRFPVLSIREIRGFFFLDLLTNWFLDDLYYDSDRGSFRADTTGLIKWDIWDSENNRLQDVRGSFGVGFQFRFFGGLQFNWAFSQTLSHTEFVPDPANPGTLIKIETDKNNRSDFYIVFDF